MDRKRKEELVDSLKQTFSEAGLVVVTHNDGLTVADMNELRRRMREVDAKFRVTKNRLAKIALDGTPYANIADLFTGPTAIAYSSDPVAAAKAAVDYAKENDRLKIVGGGLGDKPIDVDGVKALAKLPSLDELRARLVGVIQAPATKVAGVLQAPAGQLARVMKARAEQGDAA